MTSEMQTKNLSFLVMLSREKCNTKRRSFFYDKNENRKPGLVTSNSRFPKGRLPADEKRGRLCNLQIESEKYPRNGLTFVHFFFINTCVNLSMMKPMITKCYALLCLAWNQEKWCVAASPSREKSVFTDSLSCGDAGTRCKK